MEKKITVKAAVAIASILIAMGGYLFQVQESAEDIDALREDVVTLSGRLADLEKGFGVVRTNVAAHQEGLQTLRDFMLDINKEMRQR